MTSMLKNIFYNKIKSVNFTTLLNQLYDKYLNQKFNLNLFLKRFKPFKIKTYYNCIN